jgi:hypothetical protein
VLSREKQADVQVCAVHGVVRTGNGWPLPGAAVTVVGEGGRQLGRALAGDDGHFGTPTCARATSWTPSGFRRSRSAANGWPGSPMIIGRSAAR